ncbi:unnamed protein product [Urochloa humidicola]
MEKPTGTKPHFVLFPWTGTISHVIPMTDLGCLLASHGAEVTIITTPVNAAIAQSRVDRAPAPPHGVAITVTAILFPAAEATGKKVFAVGSVSLCRSPSLDPHSMSDDARRCMAWLDGKKAKSVLYVSFGSGGRMPPAQLMQLGMALVSCPSPVLWIIKGADSLPGDIKEWLRENTDGDGVASSKCLVVRGWAPQVAILAHPAVGGFMTHCGWGSTLEAVAAGVPLATWPFFAEQFINERLIVDVLGIGVSVGVTKPTENLFTAANSGGSEAEAEPEVVGMEQVKKALETLMDQGPEGEEMRKKAQELKLKAKGALEEGGSSYNNLENLIQSFA